MTHDEWWAHMTAYFAASDEERRRDREEYDRSQQEMRLKIEELSRQIAETRRKIFGSTDGAR
jgi:hypothetical protein